MKIIEIIKKLYPFDYSIAGGGNDKAIRVFKKFFPFKVHKFNTGQSYNGWKIPHAWEAVKGIIKDKNKIIFNSKNKFFGLAIQSKSFKGFVSYNELKKRIFYSKILSNATPYNWTGLYRLKSFDWGFSMSSTEFSKIKNKKYFVDIKTKSKRSTMKILEFTLKGENPETIIINAHNCHPYQANDDISGCAVGIKIFQMLQKMKKRKFTYTLLIAPELYGPVFWLKNINSKKMKKIKYAILLKAVGNNNSIKLQHSTKDYSQNDLIAKKALTKQKHKYKIGQFRTIYGNDEIVFNSPGYNINTVTFTRMPFKEYHTDLDIPDKLSEKKLNNIYLINRDIILDLEKNIRYKNVKRGVIALSNSKYNLYLKAIAPGIDKKKYTDLNRRWNLLMNNLPSCFEKFMSVDQIALKHKLPYREVLKYCIKWKNKKLIKEY
jgi:aminopeptidase-like protein